MKRTTTTAALLLLVAMSAQAMQTPDVPETNKLPNVLTPTDAFVAALRGLAEGETCIDEDQTPGMGGQKLKCQFRCEDKSIISVYAEADDEDALVSGTADCSDGHAHCSKKESCADRDPVPTSGGGTGDCSADSDEAWDSGFYVKCSADPSEVNEPPGHNEICLIEDHPILQDVCFPAPEDGSQVPDPCEVDASDNALCQEVVEQCLGLGDAATDTNGCADEHWANLMALVAEETDNATTMAFHAAEGLVRGLECSNGRCVPFLEAIN